MEAAIHVGIREGGHELGLKLVRRIFFKHLLALPLVLSNLFQGQQLVTLFPGALPLFKHIDRRQRQQKYSQRKCSEELNKKGFNSDFIFE